MSTPHTPPWQDVLKAERSGKGFRLLVRWEGTDPTTNVQWPDTWEPRSERRAPARWSHSGDPRASIYPYSLAAATPSTG